MYHVYTVNLFKLLTVCLLWNKLACRAWRFWLCALSNRGGRGQRNREEIEAGATWKNRLHGRGLFWVSLYANVRIILIGSEYVRRSMKYFGSLPWESFEGLNKSSLQNKIKISKKRWPEGRRSWIFDGKTGQLYWSLNRKWPFTVFFKGEMSWKVLVRAWSLLSLLRTKKKYPHRKPVYIHDHNLPSKSTIDDQISEMLSLSCTAMNLMTETVNFSASRKSTSIFSITRC